jgi:hypothetical protein
VTQGMGMDVLVLKTGAFSGLLTGGPENLGGDRITCRMPSVAGKQPVSGLAPQPGPVDAKSIEQLRAEHDIAVLASLASPHRNDHPLAIDIADLQACHFCATCARGIERYQQDAMKGETPPRRSDPPLLPGSAPAASAESSSDTASRQRSSLSSIPEHRRNVRLPTAASWCSGPDSTA